MITRQVTVTADVFMEAMDNFVTRRVLDTVNSMLHVTRGQVSVTGVVLLVGRVTIVIKVMPSFTKSRIHIYYSKDAFYIIRLVHVHTLYQYLDKIKQSERHTYLTTKSVTHNYFSHASNLFMNL